MGAVARMDGYHRLHAFRCACIDFATQRGVDDGALAVAEHGQARERRGVARKSIVQQHQKAVGYPRNAVRADTRRIELPFALQGVAGVFSHQQF